MLRITLLPIILLLLATGFWLSPNFKEVAAGVAIFLFGMVYLEQGFKAFTGGLLEGILSKTTDRSWKSLSMGFVATTLMQSSSLVSVITISFLSAGLISLVAGIGIIFGANLGTTTGAWLVAAFGLKVNIAAYAMPMLVFGLVLFFQSSRYLKGVGSVLAGLGFLFLGIHYMKEGFDAFKDHFDLAALSVEGYAGLFIFAGIGVLATVVMQSSHATLVLILTALAANQISYDNALSLAIGANVGTTITAVLSALGANIQGKRLAGAHLIFNLLTGLVAIVFLSQFIWGVDELSRLVGIPDDNYTLKLAMFHTLFNLAGVVLMVPLISPLASTLRCALPEKSREVTEPQYLSTAAIGFPETMVSSVKQEVWHLFDSAFEIMVHGLNLQRRQIRGNQDLARVIEQDKERIEFDLDEAYEIKVKALYAAIIEYISKANNTSMPAKFTEDLYQLRTAASEITECVKHIKHLRKNVSRYMLSQNSAIREEYNVLRLKLAIILREVYRCRVGADNALTVLELDELKVMAAQARQRIYKQVNQLLRGEAISPLMATSLLNDFSYSDETANKLIESTQVLLSTHKDGVAEAVQDVILSRDEIKEISSN